VLGIVRRQRSDGEDYDGKHEKIESWELPIVEILHKKGPWHDKEINL
jgi:hypothetical protein